VARLDNITHKLDVISPLKTILPNLLTDRKREAAEVRKEILKFGKINQVKFVLISFVKTILTF
jgi:hypothetical protein